MEQTSVLQLLGLSQREINLLIGSVIQPHQATKSTSLNIANKFLCEMVDIDWTYFLRINSISRPSHSSVTNLLKDFGLMGSDRDKACIYLAQTLDKMLRKDTGPWSYKMGQVCLLSVCVIFDYLVYTSFKDLHLKDGHLLPHLTKSIFIITRESGFCVKTPHGVPQLRGMETDTDSDGSFMTGLVSFRDKNPYLNTLLQGLMDLDYISETSTLYRDLLIHLGAMPPLVQTYFALLANRVRVRNLKGLIQPNSISPVTNLGPAGMKRCDLAGVDYFFGENYAGNWGRLSLVEKGERAVVRDLRRSSEVLRRYFANYKTILHQNKISR